jgi:hypothetical protein
MAGTEAPHQRPEEKRKHMNARPSFCEVFSLPQSKIENRKSKILLPPPSPAASLPPSLQSLLALWSIVRFLPFFKAVQSISNQNISLS